MSRAGAVDPAAALDGAHLPLTGCSPKNTWASTASTPLIAEWPKVVTIRHSSGVERPEHLARLVNLSEAEQRAQVSDMASANGELGTIGVVGLEQVGAVEIRPNLDPVAEVAQKGAV